jgi:hypothetical protein
MSNRPKPANGEHHVRPRPGEAWLSNAAVVYDGNPVDAAEARQHTHDALYAGTDGGRLMRRPPGVHWTHHTGADAVKAARAIYDRQSDPEAQRVLAVLLAALAEHPLAVLVVAHALVRRADPRMN